MKGAIKWFNNQKGYGFIVGEDGEDYFLHVSEIEGFAGNYPVTGQAVAFGGVEVSVKGKAAKNAVLINE